MIYINASKYITILIIISLQHAVAVAEFRILAPQIICPKHDDIFNDRPHYSIITIKPKTAIDMHFSWMVRWLPLPSPSQRLTLTLWRVIRELEKKLNEQSSTELEYIIKNNELVSGVTYVFNVTVTSTAEEVSTKSFNINYEGENQIIKELQGHADEFSIILLGGEMTYNDLKYILEAEVTTCTDRQDYYFSWSLHSPMSDHVVNVSHITGSRLEIPAHTLKQGLTYNVNCEIITASSDDYITNTSLTFSVLRRELQVYLNIDQLIIPLNHAFTIEALVIYDYSMDNDMNFEWQCISRGRVCEFIEKSNESIYNISQGIPEEGEYEILLTVTVLEEIAKTNATINALNVILPVLHIKSIHRVVNENREVYLVGEASNLAPSCVLTWYFASEECLESADSVNDTGHGCLHGEPISDAITLNSIENNFLYDFIDFTNDTYTRKVEARIPATTGRARLVAECNCSISFECETRGVSYGDLYLQLNEGPKIRNFTVYPESGSALHTVFRASVSATDINGPLRFAFYCLVDNQTLLLASLLDHFAIETNLPYKVGGTDIWVEVCDSLGACSKSETLTMNVYLSEVNIDKLVNKSRAHVRRCELMDLTYISVSTVITLTNSQRLEQLTIFTSALLESLPALRSRCSLSEYRYADVMTQLNNAGVDTTPLLR